MNTAICAGSFIVQGDKVLLGKELMKDPGMPEYGIFLVGIHLPGESHLDALKRELNEELGITPTTYELFKTVELIDEELYSPIQYYIYILLRHGPVLRLIVVESIQK
jgi:8-oxo-dGTP pyrophosphatase MutT (NUDIX family)